MKQHTHPGEVPSSVTPLMSDEEKIIKALAGLQLLDYPKNTPFDTGRFVGRLGKIWAPGYERVYDARALGIENPDKPFIHVPENVGPYRFGWLIAGALITDARTAYLEPIPVDGYPHVVTGPEIAFEAWEAHGVETAVVAGWLTTLCDEVRAVR